MYASRNSHVLHTPGDIMGAPSPKKKKSIGTQVKETIEYQVGYEDGQDSMKKKALTFLEQKYMHPSVTRGSVEGQAILKVAEQLSAHLNNRG